MSLAVITVHYQNPSLTQSLIDSVKDCSIVKKIVVVSHDSFLLSSGGKLEFLQQPNRGYAAGLNRAMEVVLLSGVQTVLATNPDVLLDCKIMEALLTDHQKYGADCTFPVLSERGRNLHGYRFSKFGSLQITEDPEWFSGACFVLNVATWKKIGRFDETFFHYFEDRDLCLRILKSGGKLHQAKNILIVHQSKSGNNFVQQDLPKFAVRNHLLSLEQSGRLNPLAFLNVILRHFFYLFRWKGGWRGVGRWAGGIQEFLTKKRMGVVK